MRISQKEIEILKKTLFNLCKDAKLYLFGSRVDDAKKGGDIDLLIISKKFSKKNLRVLRLEFFKYFGEQKLDIVIDDGSFKNPFTKIIYEKAVLL